jgi:hypothetical protein
MKPKLHMQSKKNAASAMWVADDGKSQSDDRKVAAFAMFFNGTAAVIYKTSDDGHVQSKQPHLR